MTTHGRRESIGPNDVHPNLIGGAWVEGTGVNENVNPSDTSDVVGRYTLADAAQAHEAFTAARAAAPGWADSSPLLRFEILDNAGSEILRRKDELGDLLAREEGKTLPEAVGEVVRAAHIFKFHAGQALRPAGQLLDSIRPGVEVAVTREPVGVVSIITPWNFPIAIPAWKIAPALAYGNTVVFKPAELVPGSAWELVNILHGAGLPAGVLNLVMGRGRDIGDILTSSADAVSFTGSVQTGERVLASAQGSRARVQLEMGGKNPLVVLDDADLGIAVECALQVGDARAAGTQMGPVVDPSQLAQDEKYVDIARHESGTVIGGRRLERASDGFYLEPALVVGTKPEDTINRDEVFGPVASVVEVASYDEALAVANGTEFGLTSGIVTTSLAAATDFRRRSTAGMVMVNVPTAGVDFHVPFGGRQGSSYGPREQGEQAREFFTTVKTSYIAAGLPG